MILRGSDDHQSENGLDKSSESDYRTRSRGIGRGVKPLGLGVEVDRITGEDNNEDHAAIYDLRTGRLTLLD